MINRNLRFLIVLYINEIDCVIIFLILLQSIFFYLGAVKAVRIALFMIVHIFDFIIYLKILGRIIYQGHTNIGKLAPTEKKDNRSRLMFV